ncbi:MAG TPA: YlbF family regulator [Phycisphaerae bacterium]|nr:YlbF family regulator [Phycisphaerae bacterium]
MADTAEVLSAAHKLGALVATHPIAAAYKEIIRQLELDVGAKQLLQQYEQLIETLAMKEQQMQPIEVAEKQQFERLQQSIAMNSTLKKFAGAQAEYMDFMRKLQDTINGGMSGQAAPPEMGSGSGGAAEGSGGASKIILET